MSGAKHSVFDPLFGSLHGKLCLYTTEFIEGKRRKNRGSVSALSAGAYCMYMYTHNFARDGRCEMGWAQPPPPHQTGLILPSWWNARQKVPIATLCVLCVYLFPMNRIARFYSLHICLYICFLPPSPLLHLNNRFKANIREYEASICSLWIE